MDTLVTVVPPVVGDAVLQGTLTGVEDEKFTLDVGLQSVRIEIDQLGYAPFAGEGYLTTETGDVVSVSGTLDDDLIEGREMVARVIVELVG